MIPRPDQQLNTSLFPRSASINAANHLEVGGCDTVDLAAEFGTPLYVLDEATVRGVARDYRREFTARYSGAVIQYACKATIMRALARILHEEGLGLDVVSLGELAIVHSVDYPLADVSFHGNNKGPEELRQALAWGVGRVVVDNLYELELLEGIASELGHRQRIMLRVSPGIDPHTHEKTTTGTLDSKFGLALTTGQAEEAVRRAQAASHLDLTGLHFHLGSPIFELEPYAAAIQLVMEFAARMRRAHGLKLADFSPGGGFAVQYVEGQPAPPPGAYAETIVGALKASCERLDFAQPTLLVEPGRAVIGQAGVALYAVGATKEIPAVRTYVAVDGGMADNARPALYGSRYEALCASRARAADAAVVTLAGRYCESGDVLVRDVTLPALSPGDLVALPSAGAYQIAMASNYNAALKPAVVLVRGGQARLIRRRETVDDLLRTDLDLVDLD